MIYSPEFLHFETKMIKNSSGKWLLITTDKKSHKITQ